jgi:hypothetical protein
MVLDTPEVTIDELMKLLKVLIFLQLEPFMEQLGLNLLIILVKELFKFVQRQILRFMVNKKEKELLLLKFLTRLTKQN